MNNKKRYLFGLISTLLLTVGFARAAEHFDPINRTDAATKGTTILMPSYNCDGGENCWYDVRNN